MITFQIRHGNANTSFKYLHLEMEERLGKWFQNLPNHCELGCCGFGSMYLPSDPGECLESLRVISDFEPWFAQAIEVLNAHSDVAYIASDDFWIDSSDFSDTLALFNEIRRRLVEISSGAA